MAGTEDRGVSGGGIGRSRFLKLAGLGAGLSLFPGALLPSGTGLTQTAGGPASLTDGRYPIAAWWPPPPVPNTIPDAEVAAETARRYAELAEANFTTVIGGNGVSNDRANRLALDAGGPNGLRLVLDDGRLRNAIEGAVPAQAAQGQESGGVLQALDEQDSRQDVRAQAAADPAAITQRIEELGAGFGNARYPALAGILLYDEPGTGLFRTLKFAKEEVGRVFGGEELPYVNAWPSYASPRDALQAPSYEDYLHLYLNRARYPDSAVAPPFLSFDHYPLLTDERITADYFYNHAAIRRFALRFDVPSWGFVQSVGFDGRGIGLAPRRSPDEAEVFWQINVALAYGVKGIQYFTYWTPEDKTGVGFGNALITRAGARTPLYDYSRRANAYLGAVGGQLLPLVSEAVVHAGERRLPRGAVPFKPDAFVRAVAGSPAILGRFGNPTAPNERYLLVTNRSPNAGAQTRLTISNLARRVEELVPATGAYTPVPIRATQPRYLRVRVPPGRARLYKLRTA